MDNLKNKERFVTDLVRCKDCAFCEPIGGEYEGFCCEVIHMEVKPNDFCSHAQKVKKGTRNPKIKTRKIMFKGKEKSEGNDGDWCFGNPYIDCTDDCVMVWGSSSCGILATTSVIEETVCQFTGKTDIKGRDIYENDILKAKKFNNEPVIGKVVFNTNTAGFEFWYSRVVGAYGEKATCKENLATCGKVEVIGNIFDNPELLELP